tara:strand:+ start:6047 stop:6802 length:756 start_codon:yes stop_codon:yes gene_type:complete
MRLVADWLDGAGKSESPTHQDIDEAIKQVEKRSGGELGDDMVNSGRTVPPPIPTGTKAPPKTPGITAISTPGHRNRNSPFHDPDPDSEFVEALPDDQFSETHSVLNSTNVHSYIYDFYNNTLFVTYRAYRQGGGGVAWRDIGKGQRANSPGVTYAYFHVEERMYLKMRGYASKGEFVWDALRKRGTIDGHQYEYSAVSPQTNEDGSLYVPRKATRKGLRNRSIVIGDKTRTKPKIVRNTLPEIKFSTKRRS